MNLNLNLILHYVTILKKPVFVEGSTAKNEFKVIQCYKPKTSEPIMIPKRRHSNEIVNSRNFYRYYMIFKYFDVK